MSKRTSNTTEIIIAIASIACIIIFYYLLTKHSNTINNQYDLESIKYSLKTVEKKAYVEKFMTENYVVKRKDLLPLLNRHETNKDDLDGYLRHLMKEYAETRYCKDSSANEATCLDFKEGIYESDILGVAVWANLYGNLDRKLSNDALVELVKMFIQKADLPPAVEHDLELKVDFNHSSPSKKEIDNEFYKRKISLALIALSFTVSFYLLLIYIYGYYQKKTKN